MTQVNPITPSTPPAVTPLISVNVPSVNALKNAAVAALVAALNGIVQGAASDIQNFVEAIVQDAIEAAAVNDTVALANLNDERTILQEINRVRVADNATQAFTAVTGVLLNFVVQLITTAAAASITAA
jgi:hypothetical protein